MNRKNLLIAEIPHLRRYARVLTRNPDAADDLVQASLERALRRFELWHSDRKLRPWLFTIMHNLHVDQVRRRGHQPATDLFEDAAEHVSIEAAQELSVDVRKVLRTLNELNADQRAALLLVGVEQLSYSEAAEVLGVPIGTLMSRVSRGRETLRGLLQMTDERPKLRQIK